MADDNSRNNPKEQVINLTKQNTETSSSDNNIIKQIETILESFNSNSTKQDTSFLDIFNNLNDYLIKSNEILTSLNTNLLTMSSQFVVDNKDFTSKVQENQNANFIWYLGKSAYLLEQLNEKLEKENFNNNLGDALKEYDKEKKENKENEKLEGTLYDPSKKDRIDINKYKESYIPDSDTNLEYMSSLRGTIYNSKIIDPNFYNLAQQETLARLETGIDLEKTDKNFRNETENQKELTRTSKTLKETLDRNISKTNENKEIDDTTQQIIDEFNEIPKLIDTLNTETKTLRAKKDEETKELVIQRAKEYDTLKEKLQELSSPEGDDRFIKVFGESNGIFIKDEVIDNIKESLQLYNTELYENTIKLLNSDVKSTKKGLKDIFKKASDPNNKITNFTFEEDNSIKNINAEFGTKKKDLENKNEELGSEEESDENNTKTKKTTRNSNVNNKQLDDIKKLLKELITEVKNENKERKTTRKSKKNENTEESTITIEKDISDISKSLKGIFEFFNGGDDE